MHSPTDRPTPSPSHHPHVHHLSPLLTRQPFFHPEWPHPHSPRHIMSHSMPTRLIRSMVLSHHCSLLLRPPVRQVANQAAPSVVFPPRSCTAQIPPHLPTHHPAPAWHHLWLHRVRLRIILSPHRRPLPLLHLPHPHQRLLLAPVPPSLVPPLPSSSPSLSAARSRIATSHTSKPMGSSTT